MLNYSGGRKRVSVFIGLGFLMLCPLLGAVSPIKALSVNYDWVSKPWTAKNEAYIQEQQHIDAAIAQKRPIAILLEQAEKDYAVHPGNLQAYKVGYLTLLYAKSIAQVSEHGREIVYEAEVRISHQSQPISPRFARLLFMMEAYRQNPTLEVLPAGRKLLKADPTDTKVKNGLASVLAASNNLPVLNEAKSIALELHQKYPTDTTYISLLGWVHYRICFTTKSPSDVDKAISYYQEYVDMTPPTNPFRKNAQEIISFLGQKKVEWSKQSNS